MARHFCLFRRLLILSVLPTVFITSANSTFSHDGAEPTDILVRTWLISLGEKKEQVLFGFKDEERFNYRWIPGPRKGIRLDQLNSQQTEQLKRIFKSVLSETGQSKVDAIIATEAALGVLSSAPTYRDPAKYYTSLFGQPGKGYWGLRFEGHHLSVNLTFKESTLISGTPLFLGANPETIPSGPDQGLRALKSEVDEAKKMYSLLDTEQRAIAAGSKEWFAGFLTDAGSRRIALGKPTGIKVSTFNNKQQSQLQRIIAAYVNTLNRAYASAYLEHEVKKDWENIHFFWRGDISNGEDFYYRIAGKRIFIEHVAHQGATHIHAIWRDMKNDFGGQ